MTRFSDNILSGRQAPTSAQSSKSQVTLRNAYFVSAGAGVNATLQGTLPAGAQNISSAVYVVQQGAATTNDNIIMYTNGSAANGQKVLSYLAVGSAATRLNAPVYITSAAAFPQPAAGLPAPYIQGEIPYKIIVSSVSTASYSIIIDFDRGNSTSLGITA